MQSSGLRSLKLSPSEGSYGRGGAPDERPVHYFRQSWLKDYFECPERARLIHSNLYPPDQTDASATGTAGHAAIQAVLQDCAEPEDALRVGVDTFGMLTKEPGFRWVKVKRERTALDHIEGGFYSWYDHVYPTLGSTIWCEQSFDFVFHEDDRRVIVLKGTADYADAAGLKDWKFSANTDKYGKDGWKLKRWDVQSTVYAAAAYELKLVAPDESVEFDFVNLSFKGARPQVVPVERDRRHVDFLRAQLVSIAEFIEADLPRWPLRDQHALCSPDWCLNYSACKGAYLG